MESHRNREDPSRTLQRILQEQLFNFDSYRIPLESSSASQLSDKPGTRNCQRLSIIKTFQEVNQ